MRGLAQLAQLETKGILRLATVDVHTEYEFKHSLLQEMAYRSLLMEERKRLHGLIGEALEEIYSGKLEAQAAQLAFHFSKSGLRDKALEYSRMAGYESLRLHAYGEAVSHFEVALAWAKSQPISSPDLSQAYLDLGRSLELAAKFEKALSMYADMLNHARALSSRKMELAALIAQSTLLSTSSPLMDRTKGAELSRQALKEAQEIGEVELEIRARWNLVLALGFQVGLEQEALAHGEAALELADKHQKDELRALLRNDLGRITVFCGNLAQGENLIQEALAMWRQRQNNPMVVDSLMTLSLLRLLAGRLDEYPSITGEAQALADEIENDWARAFSLTMSDRYYFVKGDIGRALTCAHDALERGSKINFIVGLAMSNIILGFIFLELGLEQEAMVRANRAVTGLAGAQHPFADEARAVQVMVHVRRGELALAEETISAAQFAQTGDGNGNCLSIGSVPVKMAEAELALAKGQVVQCHRSLEDLEKALEARNIRLFLPEVLRRKGRALLRMKEPEMAISSLQKGLDIALSIGAQRDLWQLYAGMAEALEMLGDNPAAVEHWRLAAQTVEELAGSLTKYPDLQKSFYARPAVTKVREASP